MKKPIRGKLLIEGAAMAMLALALIACGEKKLDVQTPPPVSRPAVNEREIWLKQAFYAQYREWQSVRYRYGGESKRGIDCSAFVQQTFLSKLGVSLPRSSDEQARIGRTIPPRLLAVGDLVFFRTGRHTRHVGIYLENRRFLHVSTSEGVTISSMDNGYWASRFWKATRVLA